MALTTDEILALEILPEHLQLCAKRALDGSIKDLKLLRHNNLDSHVLIVLPIFYAHLDVSRIPDKVEPEVVSVILRAKWAFFAIMSIRTQSPVDARARHFIQSKSDVLLSWLPFFYHNFLSPSAETRPWLSHKTITKLEVIEIRVIGQALVLPDGNDGQIRCMIGSIPGLKNTLAHLWQNPIDLIYDATLGVSEERADTIMQLCTFRLTVLAAVVKCTAENSLEGPSMISFFVDHTGGIASFAAQILSYVRGVITEGANIDMSQPFETLRAQVLPLSIALEITTALILSVSKQDAELRESLISNCDISGSLALHRTTTTFIR
ncbi:hypothetical protein BJ138DRAFT_1154315 [Hygrophoropsis aurantiaca]|uniref:Uncharacterized protein n=1 Tax=Hygrophoropsis aurantiaca TaxID=72124 RepID=A0ACB8A8X4_9AGAM|nr:hypothetical protein BJ138DRAFT_1154315 [Hygrophoropsis aurantiaca]